MKKYIVVSCGLLPLPLFAITDPSCPLPAAAPCGIEEVISCARENYNKNATAKIQTNEQFYDTQLFDKGNQDGFCNYKAVTGKYPPGVPTFSDPTLSVPQVYYDQFCSYQTGTYFSYARFIEAAKAINANTGNPAFGGRGGFACSTAGATVAINTAQSTQEVVNFFASEAQETTSTLKGHTTDGLYFRYENDSLKYEKYHPNEGKTCVTGINDCKTAYYPPNNPGNWVGVTTKGTVSETMTYTPYLWLLTGQEPNNAAYYLQYQLAPSPMTVLTPTPAIPLAPVPSPTTAPKYQINKVSNDAVTDVININDPSVLDNGMYVGMGSLQLTGSSMYFYYGWYNNNIIEPPPAPTPSLANFADFVGNPHNQANGFLRDGVIAFEGAFWYWMYRSIGRDFHTLGQPMYPTLHELAVNPNKPACHCIGAVTLMINGGCNHFYYRELYATYFAGSKALGLDQSQVQCIQKVNLNGETVEINGAKCGLKEDGISLDIPTQNLQTYCLNSTLL